MKGYQATTLKDLKETDSGIHVKVEAMPLSGKSDGNGGYICSLAREGAVITATIDLSVYDLTQEVEGIYNFEGMWNGTELEVHHAIAKPEGLFKREKVHKTKKRMYHKDLGLQISQELAKRKRLGL